MKLKFNGVWKQSLLRIKHLGAGVGSTNNTKTFIGWVFDKPLPTSGQWIVNT